MCARAFFVNGASVTLVDRAKDRLDMVEKELQAYKKELGLNGDIRM